MSGLQISALLRGQSSARARNHAVATDAVLVGRIAADDDFAALGELYQRYGRSVYAEACRLGGRVAAESLTTKAFLSLWRRSHDQAAGPPAVRRWLREVVEAEVDELARTGSKGPDVHSRSTTQHLASLPVAEARVLALLVLGACTFREAAALLGSSEAAVRRAAVRGLRRLHGTLMTPAT